MKKSTKTLAAAALAISALTPVAAAAANNVEQGVYTATNYYTLDEFKKLSTADKSAALQSPGAVVVVANQAYKATDVLTASNSELPTLGQKADEYTTSEGNKLVSGQPLNPQTDLKVESVSAITATQVKVTFDQAVEAVDEVVVTDKDGIKVYVKSTELAEDKKSATVTLYDALKSGEEYKVAVTVGETVVNSTFKFVVGNPETIELASQEVAADKGTVAYKILDENGVDVSQALPTGYTVSIATNNAAALKLSNGEITSTLAAGESAFLTVTVTDKDGKVVAKSERVTITAKATPVLTKFGTEWTLGDADFDSEDYKQVTSVALKGDAKLTFNTVDQYGETIALGKGKVEYTSLSTDFAIVDKATGKVTPVKPGKAAIRATLLDATGKKLDTKTIEITVTEEAKLQTLVVDKEEVSLTVGGTDATVTIKGEDQFGNKIATGTLTAEIADEDVAKLVDGTDKKKSVTVGADGKVTITALEKGTTTVTLKSGNVTKTINVKVAEFGKVVDYSLEGGAAELKTKNVEDPAKVDETVLTYEVFGKDANGTLNTKASAATFVVTDKDGKEITTSKKDADGKKIPVNAFDVSYDENAPLYKIGETYTVTATVDTLEVGKSTFTVVDNGVAPKLKFEKGLTFTADETSDLDKTVKDIVLSLVTIETKSTAKAVDITGIKFTTSNSNVIPTNTITAKIAADGEATLYISEITVDVDSDKPEEDGIFVIPVSGKDITIKSTAYTADALDLWKSSLNVKEGLEVEVNEDTPQIVTVTVDEKAEGTLVTSAFDFEKLAKGLNVKDADLEAKIEAEINKIEGLKYATATLKDLKGKTFTATVNGVEYTFNF